MKVLFVHNNYASNNSGEEHAAEGLAALLQAEGHEVAWFRKSSDVIGNSAWMKVKAFVSGLYNPKAVKELKAKIKAFQPDIIQIQNLYPFISPAIIKMVKRLGIPLVMRCPNYRLFCPTGLHLDGQGQVCEQCLSGLREFNCVRKNCENNWFKSVGYALRNLVARTVWGITTQVDAYIVQTAFQKQKFISNGIPKEKLFVVPGLTPSITTKSLKGVPDKSYVSFIGRVSDEKGIHEFIEAARALPHVPFKVVGAYDANFETLKVASPENVEWTGFLSGKALDTAFAQSRCIVVPGKWYEGFPNVITRAMRHAKPVVTSNLGAMASIINHEENGLLVAAGDSSALAEAIARLSEDAALCERLGNAAQRKALQQYSNEKVLERLQSVYNYVLS
jgi:glycosyltransferase involved in cell wall biosynthesis